jgi:Tfp pilus assembly pilus retraction ATPase PilT
MKANAAVRNNIRSMKIEAIYQTIQTSGADGMMTMDQSLTKLCKEGKIDFDIASPYIRDKATLQTLQQFRRQAPKAPSQGFSQPIPPWQKKT